MKNCLIFGLILGGVGFIMCIVYTSQNLASFLFLCDAWGLTHLIIIVWSRRIAQQEDQERKEKFPITSLESVLSNLARRGFNDKTLNAVLLEQCDYDIEKVLDRLAETSNHDHHGNGFGSSQVHSFDEDNHEALWDAARKSAAHRPPIHCPHYKAPAGLAYHAASLHVGVLSRLQPIVF